MMRAFAIVTLLLAAAGCHPGEGERCNPLLFSDECTAGNAALSCVYPPHCGVAYCCPTKASSTNPNCQACPSDAGVADSGTSD